MLGNLFPEKLEVRENELKHKILLVLEFMFKIL